ncbi:hypothetical protein Tco_0990000 [Tanacetum coccineum]|uniref:Peptidase A2 domain-containing protein n=1 Tax=Tanacetum coccineum TaxID=301880 RepID=A0ABQ5EV77_9ASTR
MDLNSSVGKTFLGENVIELSSEKSKGHEDWNSLEYQDTANNGGKKETKAFIFHKMETEEASDRYVAPCFINGLEAYDGEINLEKEENMISYEFAVKLCLDHEEEVAREALAIDICRRFSILEEERLVKREALIEKEDLETFVIPIRLEAKINLNALDDTGSDINVMPYRVYKELGREEVGVTTIIAKSLILDMPIERDTPIRVGRGFLYTCGSILNTIEKITSTFDGICHQTFRAVKTSLNTEENDSDDEEDYGIQRNSFGALMYGLNPAKYLNCHDLLDLSIAL